MSKRIEREDGGFYTEEESRLIVELYNKIKGIYTFLILSIVFAVLSGVSKMLNFFNIEWLMYVMGGISILILVIVIIKAIPAIKAYKDAKPIIDKYKKNKKK